MVERRPTSKFDACRIEMAASGMASRLTWLPSRLTVSPVHSFRKSGVRHSDRGGNQPWSYPDLLI